MELAPLPGDVRKHFPDGVDNAIVSIGRDHHEATQTAFLQACQKVLLCLTGLVPINGEPEDFALSVLTCTIGDHQRL